MKGRTDYPRGKWKKTPPRRCDHRKTMNAIDGSDYTADEVEFLMAIDKYRQTHGPCKTQQEAWLAGLRVLKSLGYSREK